MESILFGFHMYSLATRFKINPNLFTFTCEM